MAFLGLSEKNEHLAKSFMLMLFVLAFMFFGSLLIGFGKQGFNVSGIFQQFLFYTQFAVASAVIILICLVFERIVNKDDGRYGDGVGFYADGKKPFVTTKIFNNPVRLALGSLIVFSILGLVVAITRQTFFGIGQLQQAFTKLDNTLYNLFQVVPSENLGAAALFAVTILVIRFYARRNSMTPQNFLALSWIFGLASFVAYGYVNHLLRYSGQDVAIQNVIFIWFLGGMLTLVSGSFIPFFVLHAVNNVVYDISRVFRSDVSTFQIQLFIGGLIAIYLYKYVIRAKKKEAPA